MSFHRVSGWDCCMKTSNTSNSWTSCRSSIWSTRSRRHLWRWRHWSPDDTRRSTRWRERINRSRVQGSKRGGVAARKRDKKEERWWLHTVQMDESKKRKLIYKQLNHGLRPMTADEAASIPNLWSLHPTQRWRLYLHWRDRYVTHLRQRLEYVKSFNSEKETWIWRLSEIQM